MKYLVMLLILFSNQARNETFTYTEINSDNGNIPLGYPVPIPVDSLTPVDGFRSYQSLDLRHQQLAAQVWENEADQYSYQLLQGIEQLFAKEEVIKQLNLASHNSQLASQAILKLTTVFIDDDSVQNKLLTLLNEKDTAWHVAMAVCSSQHEGMIDKIMQLGRESSAILYVKRCMKEVL